MTILRFRFKLSILNMH